MLTFCVELFLRPSISDNPHQKTEEGAVQDGPQAQSQPAAKK